MSLNVVRTRQVEVVLLRMLLGVGEGSEVDTGNMNHTDDVHGEVGDSSGLVGSRGLTGGSETSCLD